MKMIGEKLLVQPAKNQNVTESGFIMPEAEKKEKFLEKGELITKGSKVSSPVNIGDTVYYDRYAGTPVTIDGEAHLVMKDEDLQAFENNS